MDWQSYEELVKDIYEQLGESSGVEILGWGRSCKIQGKSKAKHQIDVLTSHTDGLHTYRTAIECKYWNKKVSKDAITKLSQAIEDARIEKGVVVSKSGFTRDAELVAQSKNITLVVLRKPVDEDWDGYISGVNLHITFSIPEFYDYKFILHKSSNKPSKEQMRVLNSEVTFHMPNRKPESLHEISNAIFRSTEAESVTGDLSAFTWTKTSSQEDEVSQYTVKFPDDTYLSIPFEDSKMKILEVRFKAKHLVHKENIEINIEDRVAWILYEIFGDKKFALDTEGTMRQFD